MDRGRKWDGRFDSHKRSTVGSDSVCSDYKLLILTAFAFLPHPARPKSGLFMQASHPQMHIHMNSKHSPGLAVFLSCPNTFFFTTRLQIKINWKEPGPDASRKCLHISNSFNPRSRASEGGDRDLHVFFPL